MADNIRATPRNEFLGLLADAMYGGLEYMKDPRRTQQMQGLAGLLESTGIPKTTERMAYGEDLTNIGRANVPLLKPETAEAMMTVAPLAPAAGKAAKGLARMYGSEINAAMMGERGGLLGAMTPQPKLLDVYHGTPHTLPPTERNPLGEFDASKIGTGEGAQTFGYGIYTAENPAVAKEYQFMEQNWFDTSKAKYKGKSIDSWYQQAQKDQEQAFRTNNKALEKDATARLAYWENIMTHKHPENVLSQFTDPEYGWDEATKYAKSIDLSKFKGIPRSGNLYKVDLPDEKIANMLDWDKPMAEQRNLIEKMRKALVGGDSPLSRVKQFEINDWLNDKVRLRNLPPQSIINLQDPQIVKRLSEAGIPGVKYLDQFSREAGKGTRNFVTFPGSEKSMTILERNSTSSLLD